MIDVSHCQGCEEDFYNGKNPYGVKQCWHLKEAKPVPRLLIHIDQPPPYLNVKPRQVPNCYRMKRHATVKPESLGSDGYWRMS
ncbi:MAG TPA: hypothetical protein VNL17_14595 [Verrucomicrobiae bacterium]|nr:hypothetical protein [Verrucomicrobiae bacterium]